jgi:hypothetical protein
MSISVKQGKLATWSGGYAMPGAGNTSQRMIPGGNGYVGDPGIFGTIWGGIKGAVGGLVTGGPLGMVGGAIRGALDQGKTVTTAQPFLPPLVGPYGSMPLPTTLPIQEVRNGGRPPTGRERVEMILPGGRTGYEAMTAEDQRAGRQSSAGYHWNKAGYFLKSGQWVGKGTREVKNRRRNPLNPRALDRSISRITSAKRASKKLGRISIRKAAACR